MGTPSFALPSLPNGYTARAATYEVAPAVAALRTACQVDEGDTTVVPVEEQFNDWEGVDLSQETVVVLAPDGMLVANADLTNRRSILISVHGGVLPEARRRGLDAYLVEWGETWTRDRMGAAPPDAQVAVQHYLNATNRFGRALLERLGYASARVIYVMHIALDTTPSVPEPPEGMRVRTFVPGRDERATFETIEAAFQDLWGRPPGDFDRWVQMTQSERDDPGLWFLAEDQATGELAGVCCARIAPGTGGWVGTVGVRRRWRGRGIAFTLLRSTFAEMYRRGVRTAMLSVDADSPTGAPRLYTRAGMAVAQGIHLYRKEVRPGKDYTALVAREGSGGNGM